MNDKIEKYTLKITTMQSDLTIKKEFHMINRNKNAIFARQNFSIYLLAVPSLIT